MKAFIDLDQRYRQITGNRELRRINDSFTTDGSSHVKSSESGWSLESEPSTDRDAAYIDGFLNRIMAIDNLKESQRGHKRKNLMKLLGVPHLASFETETSSCPSEYVESENSEEHNYDMDIMDIVQQLGSPKVEDEIEETDSINHKNLLKLIGAPLLGSKSIQTLGENTAAGIGSSKSQDKVNVDEFLNEIKATTTVEHFEGDEDPAPKKKNLIKLLGMPSSLETPAVNNRFSTAPSQKTLSDQHTSTRVNSRLNVNRKREFWNFSSLSHAKKSESGNDSDLKTRSSLHIDRQSTVINHEHNTNDLDRDYIYALDKVYHLIQTNRECQLQSKKDSSAVMKLRRAVKGAKMGLIQLLQQTKVKSKKSPLACSNIPNHNEIDKIELKFSKRPLHPKKYSLRYEETTKTKDFFNVDSKFRVIDFIRTEESEWSKFASNSIEKENDSSLHSFSDSFVTKMMLFITDNPAIRRRNKTPLRISPNFTRSPPISQPSKQTVGRAFDVDLIIQRVLSDIPLKLYISDSTSVNRIVFPDLFGPSLVEDVKILSGYDGAVESSDSSSDNSIENPSREVFAHFRIKSTDIASHPLADVEECDLKEFELLYENYRNQLKKERVAVKNIGAVQYQKLQSALDALEKLNQSKPTKKHSRLRGSILKYWNTERVAATNTELFKTLASFLFHRPEPPKNTANEMQDLDPFRDPE